MQNDLNVNVVADNDVSGGSLSVGVDGSHNSNDNVLILKPRKSVNCDDKSIVSYYLQYRSPGIRGPPAGQASELCVSSFAGCCVDETMTPHAVISANNIDTNTTNSLSQGGCQVNEQIAVEGIELNEVEMPDIHYLGSINGMSIMNWVKFDNLLEYRLVYIHIGSYFLSKGFYWAICHLDQNAWHLSPCPSVPGGNLQVLQFLYVKDEYLRSDAAPDEVDMYVDYLKRLTVYERSGL